MMYAKIPQFDVAVQRTTKGVACLMCSFGDLMEQTFIAESTQEMVDHLQAHTRKGDIIPDDIIDTLWEHDSVNYPQNPSRPG